MATLKVTTPKATTKAEYIDNIKRAKVEYAFYLKDVEYDWYLADEIVNFIDVHTPMDAVIAKLNIVLSQVGY